jgi:putative endonuclease
MKTYYVYIMSNNSRTLYTGVTNDLKRRVFEHKRKLLPGFTRQYNINRLVYYESCGDIRAAIQREKQIKGWVRAKKVALILSVNHARRDLSEGWYGKDNCRDSSPRQVGAQNDRCWQHAFSGWEVSLRSA